MKNLLSLLFVLLFSIADSYCQFTRQNQDSIRKLTQNDHQAMMKLLGITSLRPGPSGTSNAPNAANYDESKATQYTSLPDPLILNNRKPVKTAKVWWKKRRPEIEEFFDREIYGRVPANVPAVRWELVSSTRDTVGKFFVTVKKLAGHVDNSSYPSIVVNIDLTLTTPADVQSPVPVIMEFGFSFPAGIRTRPAQQTRSQNTANRSQLPAGPTWQEQVLEAGWGYAILVPGSIQADNGAGLRSGIIGLTNKGELRKADDWGSLRAWAWGASRALDYFENDPAVDGKGMFLGGAYAGPVYELLGKKSMGTTEFPGIENGLMNGDVAFRQHSGGHTTGPNWPYFIQFTKRYF